MKQVRGNVLVRVTASDPKRPLRAGSGHRARRGHRPRGIAEFRGRARRRSLLDFRRERSGAGDDRSQADAPRPGGELSHRRRVQVGPARDEARRGDPHLPTARGIHLRRRRGNLGSQRPDDPGRPTSGCPTPALTVSAGDAAVALLAGRTAVQPRRPTCAVVPLQRAERHADVSSPTICTSWRGCCATTAAASNS